MPLFDINDFVVYGACHCFDINEFVVYGECHSFDVNGYVQGMTLSLDVNELAMYRGRHSL